MLSGVKKHAVIVTLAGGLGGLPLHDLRADPKDRQQL